MPDGDWLPMTGEMEKVIVPVPPVALITICPSSSPAQVGVIAGLDPKVMAVGWPTLMLPVPGLQPKASVTLYGWAAPAKTPVNKPVVLVWPLKVKL